MKKYILALDEGTTSARAILFDNALNIVSTAQHEFLQIYPQPGWVEHDPMDIYANQYSAMTECIVKSGIAPEEIDSIGITNQRETAVLWNKETGKPVYNAIVWQCRRTEDICLKLAEEGMEPYISRVTGLKADAYFSGTKIKWILDNVEGVRKLAEQGKILFGTVDTWLVWKLTGGKVHVTDKTNASRTMLYDIENNRWDDKMLEVLDIPKCILPTVKSSSEIYGYADIMGARIPISGIAGDQQAALFGQGCFDKGQAKNTYGTGCFLLANTGERRIESKSGLITTLGATCKGEDTQFVLEGSVFTAGALIQWLRDEMRFIVESKDSEYFADKVKDTGGVYVVPAFSGLGAPYWNMKARGAIFGVTRGTNRNHIIRAALEAIAFQTNDVIKAMEADMGVRLNALNVDGGASANDMLMQLQADISRITVLRRDNAEVTALGAALLAGLATGFFKDKKQILEKLRMGNSFSPQMTEECSIRLNKGWHRAVKACMEFSKDE